LKGDTFSFHNLLFIYKKIREYVNELNISLLGKHDSYISVELLLNSLKPRIISIQDAIVKSQFLLFKKFEVTFNLINNILLLNNWNGLNVNKPSDSLHLVLLDPKGFQEKLVADNNLRRLNHGTYVLEDSDSPESVNPKSNLEIQLQEMNQNSAQSVILFLTDEEGNEIPNTSQITVGLSNKEIAINGFSYSKFIGECLYIAVDGKVYTLKSAGNKAEEIDLFYINPDEIE
jgi:hypothetical protein